MSAVVDWTLDRPPILDIDFPNDHANGERARDVWYECRRRPNDETLPVVDLLASEVMQKQQRHERSVLWKKALRRYNNKQRNPEAEAQRKRSERLLTNLCAGLGDAEAETRLDAEVERGMRRRVEARERALQLRSSVNTARALRAQLTVQAMALQNVVQWAVEQREQTRLPWRATTEHWLGTDSGHPSHYHIPHSLARAHYAAQHPPDGSKAWDAAIEHAASQAEDELEAVRSALLDWDRLFDPDYVEPWPFDPYGHYQLGPKHDYYGKPEVDGVALEHRWARAPVPLPSVLLCWLRQELLQQLWRWPTLQPAAASYANCHRERTHGDPGLDDDEQEAFYAAGTHGDLGLDDDEQEAFYAAGAAEEATCEGDLEWAMAEETLPPPPSTVLTVWWQLSRAEKATARLLGFRFHNWHQKQIVIDCMWAELCDEEQTAARRLGFDEAQWDTHAPERVAVSAPSAAQFATALQFVATQLEQTHDAVQQLCQVCMHPFNASKEPPTRLEPTSWEPDSPYFPAWCGLLYGVGPVQRTVALPLFVRPLASRRSVHNPNGFCREHFCAFRMPINLDRVHPDQAGIWTNNCCDCAIGAPGLEPCSVCGRGLSDNTEKQCFSDVCCEVVSFYRRLCIQLEDGLSEADRAQEQERQRKLTQMTGQYYYYPQERHFKSRIRGLKSDLIVS